MNVDFTPAALTDFLTEIRRTARGRRTPLQREIRALYQWMRSATNGDQVFNALNRANGATLFDGHGVEMLFDGEDTRRRTIASYVNMGDTYAGTLLFDETNNTFYLTSYGDWFEDWERRNTERYVEPRDDGSGRNDEECIDCGRQFPPRQLDENTGRCRDCQNRDDDMGEPFVVELTVGEWSGEGEGQWGPPDTDGVDNGEVLRIQVEKMNPFWTDSESIRSRSFGTRLYSNRDHAIAAHLNRRGVEMALVALDKYLEENN